MNQIDIEILSCIFFVFSCSLLKLGLVSAPQRHLSTADVSSIIFIQHLVQIQGRRIFGANEAINRHLDLLDGREAGLNML